MASDTNFEVSSADYVSSSGVRQVILPAWADCYDWALRVEYLGLGRQGNKKSAPDFNGEELGPALLDVVLGENSRFYQDKATALSKVCREGERGRDVAARVLLENSATSA